MPNRELARPPAEDNDWMSRREYQTFNRQRSVRCWLWPYLGSRLHPRGFRPLLAYLFTEWKCNLDCHYCWAHHNQTKANTRCLSTCQHTLGYAYNAAHVLRWLGRQARNGFRGVTGSF